MHHGTWRLSVIICSASEIFSKGYSGLNEELEYVNEEFVIIWKIVMNCWYAPDIQIGDKLKENKQLLCYDEERLFTLLS